MLLSLVKTEMERKGKKQITIKHVHLSFLPSHHSDTCYCKVYNRYQGDNWHFCIWSMFPPRLEHLVMCGYIPDVR